jgi:GTP-binding protein
MVEPAPHQNRLEPKLPILAIVGRPNVGKSTLFNRLVGERKAIVHDLPGVTRDRNYSVAEWAGKKFLLVDTGGLDSEAEDDLDERVQEQSRIAMAEADVILFLFDGKGGLNPIDQQAIKQLRKTKKPVFFAVNKLDTLKKQDNLYEFYSLGLDRLFPLSAEHGIGVPDVMSEIVNLFPDEPQTADQVEQQKPQERLCALRGSFKAWDHARRAGHAFRTKRATLYSRRYCRDAAQGQDRRSG